MKKTTLSLAVVAMLTAIPATSALADVVIYGSTVAEYNVDDVNGASAEQGVDNRFGSKLGFKATEKLGNGMSAIALLEFGYDPADGAGLNSNRQTFVGLKHKKWGFVGLGTFGSPYKMPGIKLDPFYDTSLQAAGAGGMSTSVGTVNGGTNSNVLTHDGFVSSALFYKSPSWNNAWLSFVISPDEKNGGALNGNADDGDDNDFSVSVVYKNGPIYAATAYASNSVDGGTNEDAWKIAMQMSMAGHTLGFQYEWIDNSSSTNTGNGNVNRVSNFSSIEDNAGGSTDGEVWFLSYGYKMGNNKFIAQFGETNSDEGGQESEYMALGMYHYFSKKTRLFAGYSESDTGTNAVINSTGDREVWTIGLRKDF